MKAENGWVADWFNGWLHACVVVNHRDPRDMFLFVLSNQQKKVENHKTNWLNNQNQETKASLRHFNKLLKTSKILGMFFEICHSEEY